MAKRNNFIVHPHKFNLWLGIISLIMVFGGLTSAYLVARSMVKQPEFFDIPNLVWTNTGIILLSSLSMQFAVWRVKKGDDRQALIGLILTFLMGIAFLIGQWNVYQEMVLGGNYFVDPMRADDSVAYFYILTGLHGSHIIAGLIVLAFAIVKTAFKKYKPGKKVLSIEMSAIFWHFLDLLWVYLFVFLLYTQQA